MRGGRSERNERLDEGQRFRYRNMELDRALRYEVVPIRLVLVQIAAGGAQGGSVGFFRCFAAIIRAMLIHLSDLPFIVAAHQAAHVRPARSARAQYEEQRGGYMQPAHPAEKSERTHRDESRLLYGDKGL